MSAEIKRQDIIADDAVTVPKDLAANIDIATAALDRLIAKGKEAGTFINQSSSLNETKKATQDLTQAQIELEKVQKQLSAAYSKNNEDYIASKKLLQDLNQTIKDKTVLGNKEALTVDAQTASIKQLEVALNKNRTTYENLRGEAARNSLVGQQLKKVIDEQRDAYTKLEAGIGKNKETVGAYREELEGLLVIQEGTGIGLEGLITKVRTLGKAFLTLLTNPVFLAFAALAVVIGATKKAVEAFFETSGEGEASAQRITAAYNTFFVVSKKGFSELGKQAYETFGGDNGVNSLILNSIAIFSDKAAARYARAAGFAVDLVNKQRALNEELNTETINRAKNELEADQLIIASKDKLLYAETERLKFAKDALKIRQEQSNTERELAEKELDIVYRQVAGEQVITVEETKQLFANKSKVLTEDQSRRIAEATAEVYKKQNDQLSSTKRLTSEISTIQLDIEKHQREAVQARQDAQSNLRLSEYNAQLKISEDIIKNVNSTQDEVTNAIVFASIQRQNILGEENTKELLDAKRAAEDRARTIKHYSDDEIAAIVSKDITLQKEQKRINTAYYQSLKDLDIDLAVALNTNVFTRLQQDYDNLTNDIKKNSTDQLNALEKTFLAGGKTFGDQDISSIEAYEKTKKSIIDKSNRDVLIAQSKFFTDQIDKLNISNVEKQKLYAAVSKSELDITSIDADKQLAIAKKVRDAKIALVNEVANASIQSIQDQSQVQVDAVDKQIDALKTQADTETKLAGDNQRAKDQIALQEEKREKELQDKKVQIQRRAAIYEKAIAVAQAYINVDQAATKALADGGPILEGLVIALGAVQIAAILAKPLPQYFKGVKDSPAGPAWIGEQGIELLKMPNGMYDISPAQATLVNLPKGTDVIPHDQTMKILALSAMTDKGGNQVIQQHESRELLNKVDELNKSIRSIQQPDLVKQQMLILAAKKEHDNFVRLSRNRNLGKWL